MRFAICDDDLTLCDSLKSNLYDYSNRHNLESVIDIYNSGEALIVSQTQYDVIILDYKMNGMNGLKTARLLRNGINASTCIIFLTSFPQIAISAYEVDTYRFVVKNTLYEGLFKALDDFRKSLNTKRKVRIKSDKEFLTISTDKITFIESLDKTILIHINDGRIITTRCTLSKMLKLLPSTDFVQIHKSFIVNFKYIIQESDIGIRLHGVDQLLNVSRTFSKSFKNKYLIYLKDQML